MTLFASRVAVVGLLLKVQQEAILFDVEYASKTEEGNWRWEQVVRNQNVMVPEPVHLYTLYPPATVIVGEPVVDAAAS